MSAVIDQSTEQAQPVQQPEQKPVQVVGSQPKGKKPFLWGKVNSPWVFLAALPVFGAMWLANNMWVITDNLDKPYMLLTIPIAVLSILAGWMTYKFFQSILSGCKTAWQAIVKARKEDGSAQFFWGVILVFMVVSVFTGGDFFTLLEHNVVPGLGYGTALFIDLVAVQSMRARLNAVRMRDMKGANLYLFGVLICSGASAFANVYISLAHFQAVATGVLPLWMLHVAPWFGLVFPALILLLSITADYTLDQISTRLDPDKYKEQEEKRMKLLEIQQDMLKRRVAIEANIDALMHRRERRVFFLVNLLFPVRHQAQPVIDLDVIRLDVIRNEMTTLLQSQMQVQMQAFTLEAQNAYRFLESSVSRQIASIDGQRDADLSLISNDIQKIQGQIDQITKVSFLQTTLPESDVNLEIFSIDDVLDDHPFAFENDDEIDTEETETVNSLESEQMTPRPRITRKLDDIERQQERNTDKLKPVNRGAVRKTTSGDAEKAKRIRTLVKRNKDIQPKDIAAKVGVTRQYASKVKSDVLKELAIK